MIKELRVKYWKSFDEAVLYIDPLTVLIGMNASGKSNLLDALAFLQRLVSVQDLRTALAGGQFVPEIRGGMDAAVLRGHSTFEIEVKISGRQEQDYLYSIEIELEKGELTKPTIKQEQLFKISNGEKVKLFWLHSSHPVSLGLTTIIAVTYDDNGHRTSKILNGAISIIAQISQIVLNDEVNEGVKTVFETLKNIFILDPIPQNARKYVPINPELASDGSNLAGVIAAMPNGQKADFEKNIANYASKLPERELKKVESQVFGISKNDAILVCEEEFVEGKTQTVDSRGLSDGTLRFLAILTAILTRPTGSLLVIEEFDNGIHPSRAGLMLDMLREEGRKRGVDVLVTTHNPAFLNEMGAEMLPFVVLSHRDPKTGLSKLTQIEDLPNIIKLLAKGMIGDWLVKGYLQEEVQKLAAP